MIIGIIIGATLAILFSVGYAWMEKVDCMKQKIHVEIYREKCREWRWRLVAANNRIIADSGEGYKNKKDCIDGVERCADYLGVAPHRTLE